jgi:hypothetical protein
MSSKTFEFRFIQTGLTRPPILWPGPTRQRPAPSLPALPRAVVGGGALVNRPPLPCSASALRTRAARPLQPWPGRCRLTTRLVHPAIPPSPHVPRCRMEHPTVPTPTFARWFKRVLPQRRRASLPPPPHFSPLSVARAPRLLLHPLVHCR